jgi:hypothetical protein
MGTGLTSQLLALNPFSQTVHRDARIPGGAGHGKAFLESFSLCNPDASGGTVHQGLYEIHLCVTHHR